jgi:hypothetical protein
MSKQRTWVRHVGWLLSLCCLLTALPSTVLAQSNPVEVSIERIGFDAQGNALNGAWVPVVVTGVNTAADIRGSLVIDSGRNAAIVRQPLDLPGGARKQVTLLYRTDLNQSTLTASFVSEQGDVLATDSERYIVHDSGDALVGVFGGPPTALAGFRVRGRTTTVLNLPGDVLPATDAELMNFSVIAIVGEEPTAEQAAALQRWVVTGGTLLIDSGPSSQGTPASLSQLTPAQATGAAPQTAILSGFGTTKFLTPVTLVVRPLLEPAADATVLAQDGSVVLIAQRPLGMGKIIATGFDIAALPVDDTRNGNWRAIITPPAMMQWNPAFPWRMGNGNNTGLPSSLTLALLILGYILVVGPLNYFVLRRLDRREWAWVSIPGGVLLFMVIAYLAGGNLRGASATALQVAVVDTAPGLNDGRVNANIGFSAGRRGTWTTTVPAGVVLGHSLRNQFAGIMDSQAPEIQQNSDGSSVLPNWSANVGEIRHVTAVGAAAVPYRIEASNLQSVDNRWSSGTITNRGSGPIERAYLVINENYLRLPTLQPNESYTIDPIDQSPGFPYVFEGGTDDQVEALTTLYDSSRSFDGNTPFDNSLFTPRLIILDSQPTVPSTLDGGSSGTTVTIYNFLLTLENE